MSTYDAPTYWQSLLTRSLNLKGVSWPDLSLAFLQWQYKARRESLARVVPDAHGLNILDVGSGVGFWITHWHSLNAATVSGMDLTPVSVDFLKSQFPNDEFTCGDVSKEVALPGPFDLISGVDVLLHITDDAAYLQSLKNLRAVASENARLVLVEPIALGYPIPFVPGQSSRARSLATVRRMLEQSGWRLTSVQPTLWLLNNPIEATPSYVYRFFMLFWILLGHVTKHETLGNGIGAMLYPLDRLLCLLPWGPSSKTLIAHAV